MKILSLFDWMACWYEALQRAWIKIDKYYASEIDKYAIQIATKNHPDIIEIWDVTQVKWEDYKDIDLLIWWSPCQWFSLAWKQLNFSDERSKLFFEFVRLKEEIKPKYFLLENVKMKKEYEHIISEYMWVEPIEINSALLSAQNRKRLYRTNIPWIEQPKDKWLLLKDILEENVDEKYYISDKQFNMIRSWNGLNNPTDLGTDRKIKRIWWLYWQVTRRWVYDENWIAPTITASMWMWWGHVPMLPCATQLGNSAKFWNSYWNNKAYTLRACQPNWVIQIKNATKQWYLEAYPWDWIDISYLNSKTKRWRVQHWKSQTLTTQQALWVLDDNIRIRKLTPIECERLQTLPDNYTEWVSDSQRYKMLGNWWTVDVIAHIFSFIIKQK